MSKPLQEAVSGNDHTPVEVMIYMKDKVNLDSMLHEFRTNKTKLSVRAKTTMHALMQKANTTQAEAIAFLTIYGNQFPGSVERVESYWIANVMVVKMAPNLVPELQNLPSIERMELCSEQTLKPVESMKPIASEPKSVGGHEIGLEVIKSTALWAMGYTGHGRLMYSVDTGSWPQHPAIGNRFKGNFFPIDQAWYAFDSPIPADKSDSHGTHILGTTLGLDTTTHDTIGSAFNAYWIATDPIVEDLALIKPMSQLLLAFQWGLNPDGDTATTDDIPDAINNSWGIALTPGADTLCHSLASDMFMAVEAVGTAAIFAAGNEGPDTLTVGRPAFISNSEVDIFSVGALNGNSPDYAIASFSSRGPSVCGGNGSLLIKPEVSAPGVNVRSSIGQNGYSQYSGTSMASPHVTGAVLLLKEAFPYLAGEEIKRALYFTATDMGVAGEDNVYGMGLINVEAAFNYLSQSYVPVPPDARTYDVAIVQVAHPANGSVFCDESLSPQVVLKNLGDSTITQAYIYYGQVGGTVYTFDWVGQLAAGESETLALPAITFNQYGPIELSFRVELNGNFMEYDAVNNRRMARFNRSKTVALPFFEGFEQGINPEVWYKQNPDGDKTWDTVSTDGLLFSSRSATMACGMSVTNNRKDGLISPSFDLSAADDSITLKFSVAYKFRSASLGDTLSVWVSTDCGETFPTRVYKKGGEELKTVEGHEANFFPDSAGQWREEEVDLSAFAGQPSVMLNFVAKNRRGNNITLDHIWLYSGLQPIGLNELEQPEAIVFPNPGAEAVRIEAKGLSPGKVLVELVDLTGKCWNKKEMECNGSKLNLNWELGQVPTGVYFIGIKAPNGNRWLKWVRE
ncbi:MAG: S8 family peptidase [Bacteroidia bacterium]|nr:S8 family peptidase [Bacteroidia bacterium]